MVENSKTFKKNLLSVSLIIIPLALGLVTPKQIRFSPKSFAQTEESLVTLKLLPSTGNFLVGEEKTLAIFLENIQNKAIDGVDIKLRFDPKKIQVTQIVPNDKVFMAFPAQEVNDEKGIILISALASWNEPLLGWEQPIEIAKVRFLVLSSGTADFDFDFTPHLTTDSNVAEHKTNLDILESANKGSYQLISP